MYWFIILLLAGFSSNIASTFTGYYSEKWGRQAGTFITIFLRDILGIPVWAIGFLLAVRDSGMLLYRSSVAASVTGWTIIGAGAIIILAALISIKSKAAAPSAGDKLVDQGLYSYVRHPIHCGTFLEFTGLFILWPSLYVGISLILGTVWIVIQSYFEEMDLKKRVPGYTDYMSRTPAFIPFKRIKKQA